MPGLLEAGQSDGSRRSEAHSPRDTTFTAEFGNWEPTLESETSTRIGMHRVDHDQILRLLIGLVQTNVGIGVFWLVARVVEGASD